MADQAQEVSLVIACIVVAVESSQEHGDLPEALIESYAEALWKVPLENKLSAISQNSFDKWAASHSREGSSHDGILERAPSLDTITQSRASYKALINSNRRSIAARKNPNQCELEIAPIDENTLETRWDSFGKVVPARQNILGELYTAHHERPLQYTDRYAPSEIFARMKKIVREDLRTRETRRIQALNRKKAELDKLWAEAREKELENRFDNQFN